MEIARYGLLFLCVCLSFRSSAGNAWLMDPPSRSAAWNYGIKAPVNWDFRTLNCGDVKVVVQADGSRNCGMCGDPITDPVPRPNENGGIYAPTVILTRYFEAGQTAEISIYNNYPNHEGFYEFRLCENGDSPTQECLDKNLLFIEDSNDTRMALPGQGFNMIHVQLPVGLTCSHCLLQWRFRKDNSAWGCDIASGWCGLGKGPQKEYYNCADIMIGAVGMPKPGPDVIKDPTYTTADYGSAYDVSTHGPHHTTTDSGGLVGSTTVQPATTLRPATTRPPIITIPPATSPVTTSSPLGPTTPPDDKLVVIDASDLNNPMVVFDDGRNGNNNNNAGLLLLLALLPILGALGQNSNSAAGAGLMPVPLTGGPVPPVAGPIPPLNPGALWGTQPYLSELTLGNSFGYGNFGGSYGGNIKKRYNYGNKNSYYGNNAGANTFGYNTGMQSGSISNSLGSSPVGSFGTNTATNSFWGNTGGSLNSVPFNQNGRTGFTNQNTWRNNNFVLKSETIVRNGISRQAIGQPAVSNSILGQQSQYPSNKNHQYPTQWKPPRNEYQNNHVNAYEQQLPVTSNQRLSSSSSWNVANNNDWRAVSSNGWNNAINKGPNHANNNGLNNAISNINTNNINNLNSNLNKNGLNNLNNGWNNNNGLNLDVNRNSGINSWNGGEIS